MGDAAEVIPPDGLGSLFPGAGFHGEYFAVEVPEGFSSLPMPVEETLWPAVARTMVGLHRRYGAAGAGIGAMEARSIWLDPTFGWRLLLPPTWHGVESDVDSDHAVVSFGMTFVGTCVGLNRFRNTSQDPSLLPLRWLNILNRVASASARPSLIELAEMIEAAAFRGPGALVGKATDRGSNPSRPINEDFADFDVRTDVHRIVVADGLGGHAAGEVASQAAVKAFLTTDFDDRDLGSASIDLVATANRAVREATGRARGHTTITGALVREDCLVIAHVGDTRAYLYSLHGIELLTRDHSVLAAMIAAGLHDPNEPGASTQRNQVLRSLGAHAELPANYVDQAVGSDAFGARSLRVGEGIVLLSDGAWDVLTEEELTWLCTNRPEPQQLCAAIVATVLSKGAPDNVTATAYFRSPSSANALAAAPG